MHIHWCLLPLNMYMYTSAASICLHALLKPNPGHPISESLLKPVSACLCAYSLCPLEPLLCWTYAIQFFKWKPCNASFLIYPIDHEGLYVYCSKLSDPWLFLSIASSVQSVILILHSLFAASALCLCLAYFNVTTYSSHCCTIAQKKNKHSLYLFISLCLVFL